MKPTIIYGHSQEEHTMIFTKVSIRKGPKEQHLYTNSDKKGQKSLKIATIAAFDPKTAILHLLKAPTRGASRTSRLPAAGLLK